jgi:hypothetical protein
MQRGAQERYRIEGCFFLYGDPSRPCRASGSTQQNVQSRVIHTKLPRTEVRTMAEEFAEEEAEHVAELKKWVKRYEAA